MKKTVLKTGALAAGVVLLSGCSWVKPLPGADNVALMKISDVEKCQKLGSTRSQTLDKITFINRDDDAKYRELVALAKNEAVRMRGDTIVQLTSMKDGSMEFGIYNCY